jgi:hypothetical protein
MLLTSEIFSSELKKKAPSQEGAFLVVSRTLNYIQEATPPCFEQAPV